MDPITGAVVIVGLHQTAKPGAELVKDFLSRVLSPTADAAGRIIAHPIEEWHRRRVERAAELIHNAAQSVHAANQEPTTVPGRVLMPILEKGSMEEDADLHRRWSLLLAQASVEPDSVLSAYPAILAELTPTEARILDWMLDSYERRRDPMSTHRMIDPRTDYESNCFEVSDFVDFTKSFEKVQLVVQNILRLGLCDDQLDREAFEASLAGRLMLSTRPRRADGFEHQTIKLSSLGIAFLRACRFRGAESPRSFPSRGASDVPSETREPLETRQLRDNLAIDRLVSLGIPFDDVKATLESVESLDEFMNKILVLGEKGYGKLARHAIEHDRTLLRHLNEARALLSRQPL